MSKRQRIYINPSHADILSLIKEREHYYNLGETVELILEQFLKQNDKELLELLNDKKRQQ